MRIIDADESIKALNRTRYNIGSPVELLCDGQISKDIMIIENMPTVEVGPPKDEWISINERLPNCNGCYIVTRIIEDTTISDVCYFDGQNTWHSDNRVNHERPYLNDIIAWQPLPEPYMKGGAEE